MKFVVASSVVASLCCAAAPLAARAAEGGVSAVAGLKAWANRWTTNVPSEFPGTPGLVNLQFTTGTEVMISPSASLRYGDWLMSGSVTPRKSYDIAGFRLTREEYDINLGYQMVPGLIGSVGYKHLQFRSGATLALSSGNVGLANYKVNGPFVGLSGGAPVAGSLNIVGSVGYGVMKTRYEGAGSFDSQYVLSEVGVTYGLQPRLGLGTLALGAGYRYQSLSVKAGVFAFGQRYRDVTQGLTLTLGASF